MTLENVTVENNNANEGGGGLVANSGTVEITSGSQIRNNETGFMGREGGDGGGILNNATLNLSDSIVSNNIAEMGSGGGISNTTNGTVVINDSSINDNSANGIIQNGGPSDVVGGGISNDGGK